MAGCIAATSGMAESLASEKADAFYESTCIYRSNGAGEQGPEITSTQDEVVASPEAPAKESQMTKTLAIAGGVASFVTIVICGWCILKYCCLSRTKKGQRLIHHIELPLDLPPAYSKF
ncbi:hypothetical protein BCR34DRAFT_604799 [Clohesyomyces aquaticus]|uniref:Uncharacterized protein n=1 Tax=Clohesyomyces aquaticus TaxID=1231657 RepID=A0A1Y1Z3X9_9PLEO|nr:hypothetical protein BCR34DRAFT_604799 [Clohesyomyces aquaticus]